MIQLDRRVRWAAPAILEIKIRQLDKSFARRVECPGLLRRLMTVLDIDDRRILLGPSMAGDKTVFERDNTIPLSSTEVKSSDMGSGVVESLGACDKFVDRDLNENFCLGTRFDFSAAICAESSFNC